MSPRSNLHDLNAQPSTPTIGPATNATRRDVLRGLLALPIVAACGPGAGSLPATNAAGFPRTVKHALGETTIRIRPQRVVVATDYEELDPVLALGIKPLLFGVSQQYGVGLTPWTAATGADRIEQYDLKKSGGVDLELIAAKRPDLIIGRKTALEKVYGQASQMAPTIGTPMVSITPWREQLGVVAESLAMEDEAKRAAAETEAAIKDARSRLEPYAGRVVRVFFAFNKGFSVQGRDGSLGRLLAELGMRLEPAASSQISLEEIRMLDDAELLLSPDFSREEQDALEANPLFRQVPAVVNGSYTRLSSEMARAIYLQTVLSARWAAPKLADATIQAAEGRGKKLD